VVRATEKTAKRGEGEPDRQGTGPRARVSAVVVNHDAGGALEKCVDSLLAEGVSELVVVDNGSVDGSAEALAVSHPQIEILRAHKNLGYGAGVNLGLAHVCSELVLVSNPDVVLHQGAIAALEDELVGKPALAIVGPLIEEPDGSRYPSARRFPSLVDGFGHALLGPLVPRNRFTRRYRMEDAEQSSTAEVDWVSGACFLARRRALSELGGFDEAYFMYVEDVDLCWRARRAGWGVAFVPAAAVTHLRGVSTSRRPYQMLVAHHVSAFRFAVRTSKGWQRAVLPGVGALLALRLAVACARHALRMGADPE
jgi:N-acetylglucosaminyl-diphospho-decaprenol L-rhamnosyltransferase